MTLTRLLALSAAITGCTKAEPPTPVEPPSPIAVESPSPIAVEIQRGGDDGLTLRFADALRTALRRSRIFTLSSRERPAKLIFDIPRSLRWTEIDDRVQARFQVEFKRGDSRVVGTSTGTCWETNLDVCVERVISDAERIPVTMH
jgi:hypothetical protein